MSRLIDADELIYELRCELEDNWSQERELTLREMIGLVKKTPTAYDLEAVVRELEEQSKGFFVDDEELGEMFVKTIPLQLAIEIVKRGDAE